MTSQVFVYGTLKRGEVNHWFFTDARNGQARFLCEATTVEKIFSGGPVQIALVSIPTRKFSFGRYPLVVATDCNLPFLLDKQGTGYRVRGEVYEVNDVMMTSLDEFEDEGDLYHRSDVTVTTDCEETITCKSYVLRNFTDDVLRLPWLKNYTQVKTVDESSYDASSLVKELTK